MPKTNEVHIVEQARRDARPAWHQTEAEVWLGEGTAHDGNALIVNLPGHGWAANIVDDEIEVMGMIYPTLVEAQPAALEDQALSLAMEAAETQGIDALTIANAFHGTPVGNVTPIRRWRSG